MKWFYSFLKKYWLRMVSGLILVTILAATALASPYISKLIVDDVIKKQNTGLLPKLIILLLAMVVIKGVCRFFSQVLFETSSQGVLNTYVQENISGNRMVKAFAKEDFEMEKFGVENDRYRDAELGAAAIWKKYVPIFELLSNLLTLVLMFVGGVMVVRGEMTLGDLVAVNGYLWMLTTPLRMAGWWINDIQRFTTSVEKIYGTYTAEPDVKHPGHPVQHQKYEGNISFRNVSYRADDEDIIRDVSFEVKKGETVGILGTTGAGKSTIINLLCRFFDVTDGEVLVDGINVKDLDLYELRENIGIAMQDVFLFSDTIEGNIAYGRPDCSFERVKEVAKMADANLFIKNLPDGYDTIGRTKAANFFGACLT